MYRRKRKWLHRLGISRKQQKMEDEGIEPPTFCSFVEIRNFIAKQMSYP